MKVFLTILLSGFLTLSGYCQLSTTADSIKVLKQSMIDKGIQPVKTKILLPTSKGNAEYFNYNTYEDKENKVRIIETYNYLPVIRDGWIVGYAGQGTTEETEVIK